MNLLKCLIKQFIHNIIHMHVDIRPYTCPQLHPLNLGDCLANSLGQNDLSLQNANHIVNWFNQLHI